MSAVPPRYEFSSNSPGSVLLGLTDTSAFPVVGVDHNGRFVYGNKATEAVLGYDSFQLTSRDVYDVVANDANWVTNEFGFLVSQQFWNGRVTLRRLGGQIQSFTVNAFGGAHTPGGPDYIAFLHRIPEPKDVGRVVQPSDALEIGARDRTLLQMMSEGFADKEIAMLLGTSVWTVNKEVGRLLHKMKVPSRAHACILAIKTGLIL